MPSVVLTILMRRLCHTATIRTGRHLLMQKMNALAEALRRDNAQYKINLTNYLTTQPFGWSSKKGDIL